MYASALANLLKGLECILDFLPQAGIALGTGFGHKKSLLLSLVVFLATPWGALIAYVRVADIVSQLHQDQVQSSFF